MHECQSVIIADKKHTHQLPLRQACHKMPSLGFPNRELESELGACRLQYPYAYISEGTL